MPAHGNPFAEKVATLRPLAYSDLPSMAALFEYVEGKPELHARLQVANPAGRQASDRPTAVVPIAMENEGLALVDGVEAKEVLLTQLGADLQLIAEHDPARILTLGGECAVSVPRSPVLRPRPRPPLGA